nr:NAD(P)-dependent oxidoreductase [Roseomonas acroporae]
MTRVDGALMDRIDGLRLIQQWGAGLEGVDIEAATARGIAVGNVPSTLTGNAESVAEWCVMAALALGRDLLRLLARMRAAGGAGGNATIADWGAPTGQALLGRTAGIVGLGGIGKALAARLRPFGMRVVAATRTPDPAAAAALGLAGVTGMDGFARLLGESDYVFLCLPLGPATRHVMDAAAFAAMKPGAFLVNVGRGGLVDQDALLAALEAGRLAGAALDVFTPEPLPAASPLLARPEILATPHIAGVTDWSYTRAAGEMARAIDACLAGAAPTHAVNWAAVRGRWRGDAAG